MENGRFGPDHWISGTPDIPDEPTETEKVLYVSLSPDQIALEGLDRICLVDPTHPELGFRMRSDDELS